MNLGNRKIVFALAVITMLAGISLYASLSQEDERSYSPEGAWLCSGVVNGIDFLWMDIYTSNAQNPEVSGTVLCTLPARPDLTQSGHGNWIRIGKNTFAFTVWRFITGPNGMPVAKVKFWGTVTAEGENEMSGTMNGQNYTLNDDAFGESSHGTYMMKRIEVELEVQQ